MQERRVFPEELPKREGKGRMGSSQTRPALHASID